MDDAVLKLISYNPDTGHFTWLERVNPRAAAGQRAGYTMQHGYVCIRYAGVKMLAHRLAWRVYYGEWPISEIDHINGDPGDNRIANLRLATRSQQLANTRIRSDNTSGIKGVSWDKSRNKWAVRLVVNGSTKTIGRYETLGEASLAYANAAQKYFGEYARAA